RLSAALHLHSNIRHSPHCPNIITTSQPSSLVHQVPSFFFYCDGAPRVLHSFPTRRSSDLRVSRAMRLTTLIRSGTRRRATDSPQDRKSTRLNSSHVSSSYAVFCLKKKRETGSWSPDRWSASTAQGKLWRCAYRFQPFQLAP